MTGKAYYLTTLGDWQRHAARFANSHWLALDAPASGCRPERSEGSLFLHSEAQRDSSAKDGPRNDTADDGDAAMNVRILVLIQADEGAHLALEDNPAFEALPHPLAQKPISDAAQAALAPHGVAPGATTFDAAETLARVHPLLRHRVF